MISRTDTTPVLSKITIPTLIIVGEQDALTPPAIMKEMYHKIKNSDFVDVSQAGHMTPIEQPEIVTKAMLDFLRKNI